MAWLDTVTCRRGAHAVFVSANWLNLNRMPPVRPLALIALLASSLALAEAPAAPKAPVPGQKGKDVVWIPSPEAMVGKMLDMARVTPDDYVVDLGSGDGRNVIAAAKRGARALGVEYNPDLVALSKRNAAAAGVADRASFVQGDMFAADISRASALVLFLIPDNLTKLLPKFLALRPGARIVSNTYEIGNGWEPDESDSLPACLSWCGAHLYVVPGRVAGTWRSRDGEFAFEQSYQYFWGSYQEDGVSVAIEDGRLRGNELTFSINNVRYEGRIDGGVMEGTANGRETRPFRAQRVAE